MKDTLTIGDVARLSGVPAKTIRFYEAEGIIPPPARSDAGYRLYTPTDLRRLRLVHRARLLGVPLVDVRRLVAQAFASTCDSYALQVLDLAARQQAELDRRIAELQALRAELDAVAAHIRRLMVEPLTGQTVAACTRCPLIDDVSGKETFCGCADAVPATTVHPGASSHREGDTPAMTHATEPNIAPDEVLDALACDIDVRPGGAPTPDDLAPAMRGMHRDGDTLIVEFDPAAADMVAAFAEAERRCCSGIDWAVEHRATVLLRVSAAPDQLEALAQLWPQGVSL